MASPSSSTGSDPAGPSAVTLELYKLAVEMADRVSARRTGANNFFLALHAAMITVVGLIGPLRAPSDAATQRDALPVVLASVAGIALCAAWWLALRSYRDLNRAKYDVILRMEEQLPVRVFGDEWLSLKKDELPWWRGRYTEQGTVERVVPFVFAALYLAAVVFAFWRP